VTQIDLPNAKRSGLLEAVDVLKSVEGLAFCYFDDTDVVRHHLVQRIIRAYDERKARNEQQQLPLLDAGLRANGHREHEAKHENPLDSSTEVETKE
jgi:phosphate starvation-inducible protein PhoH and related proteins